MALKSLELDVDRTFDTRPAKKQDGFLTVASLTGEPTAVQLAPDNVFPWGPPIVCEMKTLFLMDTPPEYRGECDNIVLSFKNGWLPIGAMTEDGKKRFERGHRTATVLTRMHRQDTMKETISKTERHKSEAFKWLVGLCCVVAIAVLAITAVLFLQEGSPL